MASEIKADLIKDKSGTKTLATLSSSAVTMHSDVAFPAGHIIKATKHTSTTSLTSTNNTAEESDANDITVTCTAGNDLYITIGGGYGYSNGVGYFYYGMIIKESGESDVKKVYTSPYGRATSEYKNDMLPQASYVHTAVTSSVTIKRFVMNENAGISGYWHCLGSSSDYVLYTIFEVQT